MPANAVVLLSMLAGGLMSGTQYCAQIIAGDNGIIDTSTSISVSTAVAMSPLVRTWYDKRWNKNPYNDRGDSLGTANPDTTYEYVDWHPQFSAINIMTGKYATHYNIQIGTSAGGTQIWNTGKTSFGADSVPYGSRCKFITYDNADTILQSGTLYHWRMKLYHQNDDSTGWSEDQTFMGIIPDNIDSVACCSTYTQFTPIFFGRDHDQLVPGYTVNLKFPTGFGAIVDTNGIWNLSTPFLTHYKKHTYVVWQGRSYTSDGYSVFVAKYNDSLCVWVDQKEVCQAMGSDPIHYYPTIIVGADERLYLVRGGHHDQSKIYVTKSGHVAGSGIDISSWHGGNGKSTRNNTIADSMILVDTTQNWTEDLTGWVIRIKSGTGSSSANIRTIARNSLDTIYITSKWLINPDTSSRFEIYQAPLSLDRSTYPTFLLVSNNLYIYFRHSSIYSGIPRKYLCYTVAKWNGNSYEPWSSRRYIVNYHDSQEPANDSQSVYGGAFVLQGSNRLHSAVTFWDNYGRKNKGRALAYIYSDLDETSGDFINWYQLEDTARVGVIHYDSIATDSSVDYGSTRKIITCQKSEGGFGDTLIGPFYLSKAIGSFDDDRPYMIFSEYGQSDTGVNMFFAKWHTDYNTWLIINMNGKTKFRARTTGNCNNYTIKIGNGTLRGKKFVFRTNTTPDTVETFDNITTYDTLWSAINFGLAGFNNGNSSKIIYAQYISHNLPDTIETAVNFGNGGAGMYSYYVADVDTIPNLPDWNALGASLLYKTAFDEYTLYLYGYQVLKQELPIDSLYFSGEISRWVLTNPTGNNFPLIVNEKYTSNSGKGLASVSALPRVYYRENKEIFYSRGNDVIWSADKKPKANQVSGNDVRIIQSSIDVNGTKTYYERDRLTDNQFGLKTTNIMFKVGDTVPANSNYAGNVTYIVASGDPTKTRPSVTLTNVFDGYDGFEKYTAGTKLDITPNWVVTPSWAADSAVIMQGNQYQGLKCLSLKGITNCIWDIDNGTDREITARLQILQPGYGEVWLGVMDASIDSNIVVVGIDGNSCKATSYNKHNRQTKTSGTLLPDTAYGANWSNPMYAILSNNLSASSSSNFNLYVRDFDFSSGYPFIKIKGISVTVKGQASHMEGVYREISVGLTKNGSTVAGNWRNNVQLKYGIDTVITLGSDTSLWGTTFSLSEVQSPNFGVMLYLEHPIGQSVYIDEVTLSIAFKSYDKDTLFSSINEYHTAKIVVNDDSIYETHCYIDNMKIARYNALTSNVVSAIIIGSADSTNAVIDVVEYRKHVWNPPEMVYYRSTIDLLGIEDPPDMAHDGKVKTVKDKR